MLSTRQDKVSGIKEHDPFGMLLEGRNWEGGSEYRFGFNGKESDKETYGEGNIYDYGFRIYNPRLGKFLSIDPLFKSYPMLTVYQFASNSPIKFIDIDGLEAGVKEYPQPKPWLEVSTNSKILEYKEKAKQEFSKSGEIDFNPGIALSAGLKKIKLGPLHVDFNVTVIDAKIKYEAGDLSLKGKACEISSEYRVLGAEGEFSKGLANYKVSNENGLEVSEGDNLWQTKNTSINVDSDANIGFGINLLGTEFSASVNVYHLAKGIAYSIAAGSEMIRQRFKNLFNKPHVVVNELFLSDPPEKENEN